METDKQLVLPTITVKELLYQLPKSIVKGLLEGYMSDRATRHPPQNVINTFNITLGFAVGRLQPAMMDVYCPANAVGAVYPALTDLVMYLIEKKHKHDNDIHATFEALWKSGEWPEKWRKDSVDKDEDAEERKGQDATRKPVPYGSFTRIA